MITFSTPVTPLTATAEGVAVADACETSSKAGRARLPVADPGSEDAAGGGAEELIGA